MLYLQLYTMFYYQDMTMREIASVLGISVSAVGKRVKTACYKLKKVLGKEDFYE